MKKTFFLILTLAIPVSIFLFLKFFGNNTFEVPYLFESGIPGCINSSGNHEVPEISYVGEGGKLQDSGQLDGFVIYGVLNGEKPEQVSKMLVELVRIQDAFYESGSPHFLLFVKGGADKRLTIEKQSREVGLLKENSSIAYLESDILHDFLTCGIAMVNDKDKDMTKLVLADPDKHIRGIYLGLEVEQTDKLVLELKILKQSKTR